MSTSQVVPNVRVFFICREAVMNLPATMNLAHGWWEIQKIIHTVRMPRGVNRHFVIPELSAYAQLTGGLGEYSLGVAVYEMDLFNPGRERLVGISEPRPPLQFASQWEIHEECYTLNNVPFIRPGQYRFELLESGAPLVGGAYYLRVLPGV